jgi:hypothetical protein
MTAKGTVKGNIVILDEGEKLPDGARVEIRVIEEPLSAEELERRKEVFQRVLAHAIHRLVGMDDILRESRQDLTKQIER